MRFQTLVLAAASALVMALPSTSSAQDTTVLGIVSDATDSVLPGVTVTALHVETGNTFVGVSDSGGNYRVGPMRPGVYRITAELAGFSTVTRENLELLLGQSAVLNLQLSLSTVQESVTVTGLAPLVDTTASRLGGNIDSRQMQALPVNGRNWMSLTMLAPGSRANDVGHAPTFGETTGGVRTDPGYFQLNVDGQQVTQTMAGSSFGQPRYARDAIGEFQFVSGRFDATQGRSMGVQVNAVTKSGTNTFTGSTYGYFRHDSMIASDFVAKRVLPYSNQQAGGTFGGPLVRDKIHFFGYYEREREPATYIFNGPFAAFNIADLQATRKEQLAGARVDWQVSSRTRLMARANAWRNNLPIDASAFNSANHPSNASARIWENAQIYTSLTQMVGARSVHELRLGFFLTASDSGIALDPRLNCCGSVSLRGFSIGRSAAPLRLLGHTWSIRDDFTTIITAKGTHEVKLGGDFLWNNDFYEWNVNRFGSLDATGGAIPRNIESLFPVWNDPSTWNRGPLSPISVKYQQSITQFGKYSWVSEIPYASAWLQDNWTLNQSLTLNLGVRWDMSYNWAANEWDVPPIRTKQPQEWTNFAPRLGFAYTMPDERTVLRGGWGLYYVGPKDQWAHHTPVNAELLTVPSLPYDGRADFAVNPFNGPLPSYQEARKGRNDTVGYIAHNSVRTPYSYQTSIGLQRQLGDTMSFQADYVWNASYGEQNNRNHNLTYDPATGVNRPFTVFSNRRWPELGIVSQVFSDGHSNYHALETGFTKRFDRRWQASATYTLSRFWDLFPSPVFGAFPVAGDLGDVYSPAAGGQTHRAVFNGILELPLGLNLSGLYHYGSGVRFSTSYGADLRDSGGFSNRLRPNGTVMPRNAIVGDPIHRVDLKVLRKFPLYHRASVEGSFEVFNLFNHANYGNYTTSESSRVYGQPRQNLNVAYLPRMVQMGFRLTF